MELAENMTLIAEKGVSDELYNRVRDHYDNKSDQYVEQIIHFYGEQGE